MSNDTPSNDDPRDPESTDAALLKQLGVQEDELGKLDLTESEARGLAAAGGDSMIGRAASMAIAHVEREKDNPEAMGDLITQKYLDMGRTMLSDPHAAPLGGSLRQRVMEIMGYDPGDVRVHTGERAQAAAGALGAKAFAVGESDIYFAQDQFRPDTPDGMGVLVHELTHAADNQVGAAFHSGSGASDYSAAESRADAAEQQAVQSEAGGQGESGSAEQGGGEIDMDKLEAAVAKIVERGNRLGADRIGASASRS
ncbi:MAG: hypothetical protein ACI9OJ_002504 [Myxococcota bacterium]|jgi:hypothetical protein